MSERERHAGTAPPATAGPILAAWLRLRRWPAGAWLFSFRLGRMVPFSGKVRPRVLALEPGRAVVAMRDRRAVRNHLGSIHATALATLGELASGLALVAAVPRGGRAILIGLELTYEKKARGRLVASGRVPQAPSGAERQDVDAVAEIADAAGDRVATCRARWRVDPPGWERRRADHGSS